MFLFVGSYLALLTMVWSQELVGLLLLFMAAYKKHFTKRASGRRHSDDSEQSEEPDIGEDEPLYCLCKQPYDDNQFMIGCDGCGNWFHGHCVNISTEQAALIK